MTTIKRFPVPGRTVVAALLGVSTFVFVATNDAVAQKWPDKTVRIVLPFSPGGGGDTFARMVAGRLSETLSQQFVVENRPGAGSTLGTEHVAKAAPDGYTFLMTSASFVFTPGLYSKLRFDPVNDFTRVSQVASVPFVIAVLPSLPVKDLRDLVARAQSKPGGVLYASAGPGSAMHLAGALFGMVTQSQLTHVPYKGGGATVVAVMGGEATVAFYTIETVLPHIRANRMRALAVSTRDRAVALPDVPTAIEMGYKDYEVVGWFGMMAPAGTPPAIVEELSAEVSKAMASPALKNRTMELGATPLGTTPAEFEAFVRSEISRWTRIIKQAGIKLD
jgi:tripartite-type tricarboxylate transporter receptor subunit TctC